MGSLREVTVCQTAGSESDFVDTWREILLMAGCHLDSSLSTRASQASDSNTGDVVVTDRSSGAPLLQLLKELGIPIVSIEWVIQSLTCGRRVDLYAHLKYQHDFD